MSKATLEKKIIKETKDLSFDSLNEVLDFIQFLKYKKSDKRTEQHIKNSISKDLSELSQDSLNHLEQEFKDYKETYPHE